MKPRPADFPELERVFSGYLHEDFRAEHGSATAALRAFHVDSGTDEHDRFAAEARTFLERTALLDFAEVRELLARLGCRWRPRSRKELTALLTASANATAGRRDM